MMSYPARVIAIVSRALIVLFLIVSIAIIFSSCSQDTSYLYFNRKVTLVEKYGGTRQFGKYEGNYKAFLIRDVEDSTLFAELNSRNAMLKISNNEFVRNEYGFVLTDSVFYTKNIGDTLQFDYIRKDRFWKMSNFKKEKQ